MPSSKTAAWNVVRSDGGEGTQKSFCKRGIRPPEMSFMSYDSYTL